MSVLGYTSVYQLTYLLLETAEGKLTNNKVNTSFEVFLHDLNETIQEGLDLDNLEPFSNSVYEYYEASVETEEQIQGVLTKLENTFAAWNVKYPEILERTKEVLNEFI